MQLHPRRPPGRTDRKAGVYAAEISRLRAEGYTYEAIREALADVGILLTTSTLRREVRRRGPRVAPASQDTRAASPAVLGLDPSAAAITALAVAAGPALLVIRPRHQQPRVRRSLLPRPPGQPAAPRPGGPMKLAVINFSGNVGKTTIARHLLAPRIPDCQVVAVESLNADDGQALTIRGRQFGELQAFLQTAADVVVDVGASNVEELLALMRRYRGSHEDFDGFVVPTVPARKQQQDTVATLAELARIGVPSTRIRLVFNQVADDDRIEPAFETLIAYCASSGVVEPRTAACLRSNEVYPRLRDAGRSLLELASDPTDYKAEIARAASSAEKLALAQKLATQRLARGVVPELDACFAALELPDLLRDETVPQGA